MKNSGKVKVWVTVLWFEVMLLALLPGTGGAIPQKINYQGYLTNAAGVPISGTMQMVFSLYNVPSSGTPLWTEQQSVTVINGIYNVTLGDSVSIPLPFNVPYYLGITVGADPEMTPRKALTSVGYAFRAMTADVVGGHTHSGADITSGIISEAVIDPLIARDSEVTAHASRTDNPHSTTAAQVGAVALNQANSISTPMILDSQVTKTKLSATVGTAGQVLGTDGANLIWQNDATGFTLPYAGWWISNQAAFWVTNFGEVGTGVFGLASNGIGVNGEGNGNPGYGVRGVHTGTGNYGLVGMDGAGVYAYGYSNSQGVHAQSQNSTGVHGQSVNGYGLYGESTNGDGIYGRHGGMGNYGLLGTYVAGAAGFGMGNARGVHGHSENATGVHGQSINGFGVYGESTNGIAAVFRGNVHVLSKNTGAIVLEMGEGLDYAEGFDVSDRNWIIPGTVLVIDPDNPGKLTASNKPYDTKVAGIVAGGKGLGSGVRLGTGRFDLDVALAGRVYCNVDSNYGEVSPGDLLTTSPTPGYAMKVSDYTKSQGAILGKAMERLGKGEKGQILVLVTLQ